MEGGGGGGRGEGGGAEKKGTSVGKERWRGGEEKETKMERKGNGRGWGEKGRRGDGEGWRDRETG